jgi:beta-glucosidase
LFDLEVERRRGRLPHPVWIGRVLLKKVALMAACAIATGAVYPIYRDSRRPVDERVRDLLSRMTLEEKIGQMNADWADGYAGAMKRVVGGYPEKTGTTTPVGVTFGWQTNIQEGARRQAQMDNELKAHALKSSRLGIPLLHVEEGVHGLFVPGATIFPQPIGLGASFNRDLIDAVAGAMAEEARALGVNQVSTSPVLDVMRDPRMGRIEQSFGEDPYLVARIGVAWVKAVQSRGVAAMPSHFAGQGEARRGIEHGPAEVSERTFREVCLYPFEAAVKEAGALGIMAAYNEVGGIPCHANEQLLTGILRGEWGFGGYVHADSRGVEMLNDRHFVAATLKDAGMMSAKAGVDVNFPQSKAFGSLLREAVKEGLVSEAIIDLAVGRLLKVKFLLGLFEAKPVDPDRAAAVVDSAEHRRLALRAARESIVLLKNEGGLLPLSRKVRSIFVTGPDANAARNLLGGYTAYSPGPTKVVTPLEGIRSKVGAGTSVVFEEGCKVVGGSAEGIEAAAAAARKADVAIVFAGDAVETVGEAHDRADLNLPGRQLELVKAIQATGVPTVLVLTTGRPVSLAWEAEHVPAIVQAWLPGEEGGNAIADVLFGDYNPGGKLPFTFPRSVGQLPLAVYDRPLPIRKYVDADPTPLYPFGFGLSYTTFATGDLRLSAPAMRRDGTLAVSVEVQNTGARAGDEAVLLFVRQLYGSVTRPLRMLKGFERVRLEPGEKKTVSFTVPARELALWDRRMNRVVEAGQYKVMVGKLEQSFEVRD